MNFPRRRFLGSSLVVLGSSLLDALEHAVVEVEPQPYSFVNTNYLSGISVAVRQCRP